MNEIDKWIEDGSPFEQGVKLYSKYGSNKQLKETFEFGCALFDIEKRLLDELTALKDKSFIDKYEGNRVKRVMHITSVASPKAESSKAHQIVRELSGEMKQFNLSKGQIVNQRCMRANELTDETISTERARSIIMEIKYLQTELNRIREQENVFVKTGQLPKVIVKGDKSFEELIATMDDIDQLQRELVKCKKRISKNKAEQKRNPERDNYYSNAIAINRSKEDLIVNRINNLIPTNAGQVGKTIRKRKRNSE